jgi:hypothetical protein
LVLVVTVGTIAGMARTRLGARPGFVSEDSRDLDAFTPIPGVVLPAGLGYLAYDVDRGADLRNFSPEEGLTKIVAADRSPLTIAEGIALVTHFPATLEKNHCFQLAGSRGGDRRVPGIWISGRAPKLGWCWAGNRHSWLGMASCGTRALRGCQRRTGLVPE